jgi:all-trans-retinol dehydrogenase (NAD+)
MPPNSHKNVLITGGGRGLGRELAIAFSSLGDRVVVSDCELALATEVASRIANSQAVSLDVTDAESVREARDRLANEIGPIDVLVNNAGIVYGGSFLDVAMDQHRQVLAVNIEGLIRVTHAFLPQLIQRPTATIVNIASASALIALPWAASYAASKSAVLSFSDSLREELRLMGNGHVAVLAVCPGYIDTGLFSGAKPPIGSGMLSPAAVAAEVVNAVEKHREMLILPQSAAILWNLFRGLPRPMFAWICRRLGVATSMKGWRGRQKYDGTDRTDRTEKT